MPKSKTSLSELLHEVRRIEKHREVLTEDKIRKIYESLMDDLKAFLGDEYIKYADEEGRLYVQTLVEKSRYAKFLEEIAERVNSISPELKKEITKVVDLTYKEAYKGMAKAVKKAKNTQEIAEMVSDTFVRPEVLKQAVNNNISKLTLPRVLEKHRQEVIYQIQQELNIGLINGDRYETIAKRIQDRVGVGYSKAANIVRTESHRNLEAGFMDCAENIQKGLEGSGLIYTATWKTAKDERVRPQRRYKTKKGWKTSISRNGANHQKMEGVTVKAGELFNLGNGIKTKTPGKSGSAANDCNCRCDLSYDLMTVEEFAEATNQTPEQVRKKYKM